MAASASGVFNFKPNRDENPPRSFWQRVEDRCGETEGTMRILQFMARLGRLSLLAFSPEAEKSHWLSKVSERCDSAWQWLIFTDLPVRATRAMYTSATGAWAFLSQPKAWEERSGWCWRKIYEAGRDSLDWSGAVCVAGALLSDCVRGGASPLSGRLFSYANGLCFVTDLMNASMSWSDFRYARLFATCYRTSEQEQTRNILEQTQRFYLLKLMKAVSSLAKTVLSVSFAFSGRVVTGAPVILATLSLASTSFALAASFYKDSMQTKPVEFFNEEHVVPKLS